MKKQNSQTDKRRQDIIQAGLDCFTQKGFTNTTMADICKAARASTGSVYHHYKSKDKLAAAIYLEGIRNFQDGMVNAVQKSASAKEGIKAGIAFHIQWVQKHPDWAKFLFYRRHAEFMQAPDDTMHELNKAFVTALTEWLAAHAEAGTLKPMTWDIFMPIISGPCQQYIRFFLAGLQVADPDDAIKELGEAAWNALKT